MTTIRNNTPRPIFNGMKDESVQRLVPELEQSPIHYPLYYLFTQRMIEHPLAVGPNGDLARIYGAKTINERSPYFTHQTKMAMTTMAEGNAAFIKSVIPDDAEMAGLTLVAKIKRKTSPSAGMFNRRGRNADGSFMMRGTDALYTNNSAVVPEEIAGYWTPTFEENGDFIIASVPNAAEVGDVYIIDGMTGVDRRIFGEDPINNGDVVTFTTTDVDIDGVDVIRPFMTRSHIEDELGTPQPVAGSIVISWEMRPAAYNNDGVIQELDSQIQLSEADGIQTITLPIKTQFAFGFGDFGNNQAVRYWVDNTYNQEVINANKSLVLKAQYLERDEAGKPYRPVETTKSARVTDFSFNETAYNEYTKEDLYINNLVDYYNDDGIVTRTTPTFGPVGSIELYEPAYYGGPLGAAAVALATEFGAFGVTHNIEILYALMARAESVARAAEATSPVPMPPIGEFDQTTDAQLLNIFTGENFLDDAPYYGFVVGAQLVTGQPNPEDNKDTLYPSLHFPTQMQFSRTENFAFGGGSDGTLNNTTYEEGVVYEIEHNYNNPEYALNDMARYPFSAIYDSGFTLPTKEKLLLWLGHRKDVHVTLGTHAFNEKLSIAEEYNRATTLLTAAQQYAESEEFGTKTVRCVIVGHSGNLIRGTYRPRLPMTFELAQKRAGYLGAGNGFTKYAAKYNTFPGNTVGLMKNVNNVFMEHDDRELLWTNGCNFVQFADRSTLFFPALETVYDPRNSVMTSELLMQYAVDVTKQCQKVWALMSGNDELTDAQFIERSNEELAKLVAGKYGTEVRVEPNAYFTPSDTARGYSWVMDAIIYGKVMKTTATINVIVRREFE